MLKHFGMYLNTDDPEDAALIAILDRYVRSRRVGEFLRSASLAYTKQHSVAATTFTSHIPAASYPTVAPAAAAVESSAVPESIVQKARKAFFK